MLELQQPDLARAIAGFSPLIAGRATEEVDAVISKTGLPVPRIKGCPLHDADDPEGEGERLVRSSGLADQQGRVVLFGFGFGYHVTPFVRRGLSPIVYEPSLAVLHLAFRSLDLRSLIPFVTFSTGARLPQVPRRTPVLVLPRYADLFPQEVSLLSQQVMRDEPRPTGDLEEAAYYATYRNVSCLKSPCDLAVYQMLFWLVRPTVVFEIGTCFGGSALYFADLLRGLGGTRRVHTFDVVDNVPAEVLTDPLITFYRNGWKEFQPSLVKPGDRVIVIEDSSHTYENTLSVLNTFAPVVTANSYLIVEDGADGYTRPALNGGPIRAIEEFLVAHPEFEPDTRWEKFFGANSSFCLKGFLRRRH